MDNHNELSLATICGGATDEVFSHELAELLKNMTDPNTDAEKKRRITLTFEFRPFADRSGAEVEMSCKTSLVPVASVRTSIYVARDAGRMRAYNRDTRQLPIFPPPASAADKKVVQITKGDQASC